MYEFKSNSILKTINIKITSAFLIIILTCILSACSKVNDTLTRREPSGEYPIGRVIEAASSTQEDVQAAIDQAEDGDIVRVPEGEVTWSTIQPGTPAVKIDKKGITLMGAGIGKTVILDDTGTSWGENTIWVVGEQGKPFRISGLDFKGEADIFITGNAFAWRIDHCSFKIKGSKMTSIHPRDYTRGVIDRCQFYNSRVYVFDHGNGHESWERPLGLGTADAVYIEDNQFERDNHGNSVDANHGGKYVFRYNEVINSCCEAHSMINAWPESGTFARSARSYEIYNNQFTTKENGEEHNWVAVHLRGGTGVVFNNEVQNASGVKYSAFGAVDNVRSFEERDYPLLKADGSNPLDGNEEVNGYPARDQIGRSTDIGKVYDHNGEWIAFRQKSEPLYVWDNTFDGETGRFIIHEHSSNISDCLVAEHINEGRDFLYEQHPSYMPYVYPHPVTNGTALILNSLPSTCLKIGRQYSLNWYTEGDIVVGNLKLELYIGMEKVGDIAVVNSSNGSYNWTVPETLIPGEYYRIRIFQGAIMDISDEFTVE